MNHRVAFYPCCSTDIAEPLALLRDFVDTVVFCDVDRSLRDGWNVIAGRAEAGLPQATFLVEDARTAIDHIATIDVLFYRRDSTGEGGSGVLVLGDQFLSSVLSRLPEHGGFIISDGSNERGGNFRRMIRRSGLTKFGWRFRKADEQPFLAQHGLHVVRVTPDDRATAHPSGPNS